MTRLDLGHIAFQSRQAVTVGTEASPIQARHAHHRHPVERPPRPAAGPEPAGGRGLLKEEARQCSARAAAIDLPALAECRRVSWATLIMLAGTLIGGWALTGMLIDVSEPFDAVIGADWLWASIALLLVQPARGQSA